MAKIKRFKTVGVDASGQPLGKYNASVIDVKSAGESIVTDSVVTIDSDISATSDNPASGKAVQKALDSLSMVKDVRIDWSSIVDSNGVANIPTAYGTNYGVTKYGEIGPFEFSTAVNGATVNKRVLNIVSRTSWGPMTIELIPNTIIDYGTEGPSYKSTVRTFKITLPDTYNAYDAFIIRAKACVVHPDGYHNDIIVWPDGIRWEGGKEPQFVYDGPAATDNLKSVYDTVIIQNGYGHVIRHDIRFKDCVTFTGDSGTVSFTGTNMQYKGGDVVNWTDYVSGTPVTINSSFRGQNFDNTFSVSFSSDASNVKVSGKLLSLVDYKNIETANIRYNENTFYEFFRNATCLVDASNLILPTKIKEECFKNMFEGCTNLVSAPSLPATALASYCYSGMFKGCTSLVNPPIELPAKTLTGSCYLSMFEDCTSLMYAPDVIVSTMSDSSCEWMFRGCTSLVKIPNISVVKLLAHTALYGMFEGCTSLKESCYISVPAESTKPPYLGNFQSMFENCTSLTDVHRLPIKTVHGTAMVSMFEGCSSIEEVPFDMLPATSVTTDATSTTQGYSLMFRRCTKLKKAPNLPATNVDELCYNRLFEGCSSLNEVHCSQTQHSRFTLWLNMVSDTGDFYGPAEMNPETGTSPNKYERGDSGVPDGWTYHDV